MESILYNKEDKEVVIILGYVIGNHLSVQYLMEQVALIRKGFPMSIAQGNKLLFLQVSGSSRRHRYMWYTRFSYDMSKYPEDKWGYKLIEAYKGTRGYEVYQVTANKKGVDGWVNEDESAKDVMNRFIHD